MGRHVAGLLRTRRAQALALEIAAVRAAELPDTPEDRTRAVPAIEHDLCRVEKSLAVAERQLAASGEHSSLRTIIAELLVQEKHASLTGRALGHELRAAAGAGRLHA